MTDGGLGVEKLSVQPKTGRVATLVVSLRPNSMKTEFLTVVASQNPTDVTVVDWKTVYGFLCKPRFRDSSYG